MVQQLQKDIRLEEGQRIVSMDSAAYRTVEGMLGSYGFAALFSFLILLCMFLFIYNILNLSFRNPDDNEQEHNTNVKYVQKRFAELLSNAIAEYMDAQYVVKIK